MLCRRGTLLYTSGTVSRCKYVYVSVYVYDMYIYEQELKSLLPASYLRNVSYTHILYVTHVYNV